MRQIWLIVLLAAVGLPDRERDRAALLEADRAHRAFAADAMYLYPGARLVQGSSAIRRLLDAASEPEPATWTPEFADVSDDGTLGYTYGWTQLGDQRGKYLACWRKRRNAPWRISAYARTRLATDTTPRSNAELVAAPAVRGPADSRELKSADSAFAALSVARGAQAAFVGFAAREAVLLGPPGAPMTHGRDAIGAAFAGFPVLAIWGVRWVRRPSSRGIRTAST